MLLLSFVATASPVIVLDTHRARHKSSTRVTTYSIVDKLNPSDTPVYCKFQYKRKKCKEATAKRKETDNQISQTHHDPTLFFPFLCDQQTKKFLQRSKVLFIMRGLPGSGKSTIVRAITSAYPSSVVCSADDYFLRDGVYQFDAACLGSAHDACQQKAREACSRGVPVVVVDNTNVRRWEMKFYLQLAGQTDYVVVPVQPKTAWRMDAEELVLRNKHGVDLETLRRKVRQFDDVVPLYYAWFLPENASKQLASIAKCLLKDCTQVFPEFSHRMSKQLRLLLQASGEEQELSDDEQLAKDLYQRYYSGGSRTGNMMHCTAKFCGGGRAEGAKAYHSSALVQGSVGKCFPLCIHSICFSPRTAGARVSLTDQQLPLFDKPEEKDWNGVQPPTQSSRAAVAAAAARRINSKGSGRVKKDKAGSPNKNHEGAGASAGDGPSSAGPLKWMLPRNTKPLAKAPTRSAHITIAFTQGLASRETNFDVLRLCDLEEGSKAFEADLVPVTGGKARYFGDGVCCVYLDPPLNVRTLYSGFY